MYPYLVTIGFLRIPSFSTLLIAAVIIGIFIIWKQAKEKLYSEDALFDTIILTLIASVVFARIAYVILNIEDIGLHLLRWLAFWVSPGFYLYGGILGYIAVLWYRARKHKELIFNELLDFSGFALWIGLIIGFIGAFLGGVETGIVSQINQVRHPVSLYKAVALFVVLVPYLVFRKDYSKEDRFHKTKGTLGLFVLFLFSVTTLLLDIFKQAETIYGLSIDQWVSVVVLLVSAAILYKLWGRNPQRDLLFLLKKLQINKTRKRNTPT